MFVNSFAQETKYFFKNVISNDCYNGNIATNSAKSAILFMKDGKLNFKSTSIGCVQELEFTDLGTLTGEDQIFFSKKYNRGIIREGEDLFYYFTKDDENVAIKSVASTDKKKAKTLEISSGEAKYQDGLNQLDELIKTAELLAAAAAREAATYKIPEGDYKDDYGISGVYYLSETSDERNSDHFIRAVNIEFVVEKGLLNIHYGGEKPDRAFMRSEMLGLLKEGALDQPGHFNSSNQNNVELIGDDDLSYIEDGVFFGYQFSTPYMNTSCEKEVWQPQSYKGKDNHFVLLAKDTVRMKELMANPKEVENLAMSALLKKCEMWNLYRESENPMPEKGMSSSSLQADVTAVVTKGAAHRNWKEEILYAYVRSKEWATLRNKSTGIITGRELRVIAVMKTDGGKCKWEEIAVRQNFDGNNYGNTYWYGNSQRIYPVNSKDAMKYK